MRPREIGVSAVSTGAATYECTTVVTADLDALVARVATYEADNRDLTDRANGLETERDHYRDAMRVQMARVAEMEAAQTRHLELIRDMTQAPLPEDCVEARNRVGVLTAKCATLVRERSELEADNARMREALDRASAAAYDIAIGADLARTEPERSADSLEAALGDIEKRAQHAGGLARKALGREP